MSRTTAQHNRCIKRKATITYFRSPRPSLLHPFDVLLVTLRSVSCAFCVAVPDHGSAASCCSCWFCLRPCPGGTATPGCAPFGPLALTLAPASRPGHALDCHLIPCTLVWRNRTEIGGVGKRLTPAVLKTVRPERVSWVRIPPPPPLSQHLFGQLSLPKTLFALV